MNLTREEIQTLPAGIVINDHIAEVIYGYVRIHLLPKDGIENMLVPADSREFYHKHCDTQDGWLEGGERRQGSVRNYSTDIERAWPLFAGKGWLLREELQAPHDGWEVYASDRHLEDGIWLAAAPTPALAICRAALVFVVAGGAGEEGEADA